MSNSKTKGFTLIELLVVVSIIALLVSILLPALGKARQSAKKVICSTHLNQIGTGIAMYMAEVSEGKYPQQRNPIGQWNVNERTGFWWQEVVPYIDNEFQSPSPGVAEATVGNCPNHTAKDETTRSDNQYSYCGNNKMMTDWLTAASSATASGSVQLPSEKLLVYECHTETWIPVTGGGYQGGWLKYPFYYRADLGYGERQTHENVSNFLFCDNHVASIHGDDLKYQERHWVVR